MAALKRPLGSRAEQFQHYLEWVRKTTGEDVILRKSLDALLADAPLKSVVWDYQQLANTNETRRGIWTRVEA